MKNKFFSIFLSVVLIFIFSVSSFSQTTLKSLKIEKYNAETEKTQNSILEAVNVESSSKVFTNQSGQDDNERALLPIGAFTGTSGNGRCPQGSRLFVNTKAIYSDVEMAASGFTGAVTSVQFTWGNGTAQNIGTTGNLKIFLKDTTAGASSFANSNIDTTGAGGVKVFDGTITIPAVAAGTEFSVNVPVGGPGTGTYTYTPGNGLILIFVYKTTTTLATPLGAPTTACFVGAVNSAATFQSNTAPGVAGAFSTFRPFIALGNALVDAISMGPIYSLGEIGICPCPDTNLLRVNMFHLLAQTDTVVVTTSVKNVVGGGIKYEWIDTIVTDTIERWVIFYVYPKDGSVKKSDSIITTGRILGSEGVLGNNRDTYLKNTTLNRWNQAEPNAPIAGGVGFTGATGDFVSGFYASCNIPICAVDMKFNAATGGGNQPFNLKIFAGDDDTLKPGALLYESPVLTSPAGSTGNPQSYTYYLPVPVTVSTGYYYVGLAQTATTNISFAFQEETPIRFGDFFFASPVGSNSWTDFAAAGADFLLDIAPRTYLQLDLGVYLEGFFNGSTMVADTVTIVARSQTSPFNAIDTARAVVSSSGTGTFNFCKLNNNDCYYYDVRHRNHIETYSHSTCEKIDECGKLYNFRDAANKAFGDNMKFITGSPGGYALYGGDVNQDGIVDLTDLVLISNDASVFTTGYVVTDANGDSIVDLADMVLTQNNSSVFVAAIIP